jgi:glucose-1-phosphate adenylyltransferase
MENQDQETPRAHDTQHEHDRFVSRLTRKTLALVLAGGRGSRLKSLTDWRAKPAVPFGGKFRIIDFPLSNCLNSGIRRIAVLTQYKAHSLMVHLQRGWGSLRGEFGEFVEVLPAQQRLAESWYQGTADAVYQNIDILRHHDPEYVLILAGDHIYKMDYGPLLAEHVRNQADITVGCIEVDLETAQAFGVMSVDAGQRITSFQEKPANPESMPGKPDKALASMGIYVFNAKFLYEQLYKDAHTTNSSHDFGKDLIPHIIKKYRAFAYPFRDTEGVQAYWRDVGTVDAFWESNLDLVEVVPDLNLYDKNWPIWTYQEQLPPAKFVFNDAPAPDGSRRRGMAVDSTVSGGCIISGAYLERSLLFSNVHVHSYAHVENSVILPNVDIGERCYIKNAVLDKGCHIPADTKIGLDLETDRKRGFYVSAKGIVLVTPDMLGQDVHRAY